MNRSRASELVWAALDAFSVAQTLDRLTAAESGLSACELARLRAQVWALVDGLEPLVASLTASWAREPAPSAAPAWGGGVAAE